MAGHQSSFSNKGTTDQTYVVQGKQKVEVVLPASEQKVEKVKLPTKLPAATASNVEAKDGAETPRKEEFRFPWAGGKKL